MKALVTQLRLTLCDPMVCPWTSLGKNTGVGSQSLLQRIFLTQGLNQVLLHYRQIFYLYLSYKGSPQKTRFKILLEEDTQQQNIFGSRFPPNFQWESLTFIYSIT